MFFLEILIENSGAPCFSNSVSSVLKGMKAIALLNLSLQNVLTSFHINSVKIESSDVYSVPLVNT